MGEESFVRGFMVAVTERCKDNKHAINRVLTGELKIPFCNGRVVRVTSSRDNVSIGLFNRIRRKAGMGTSLFGGANLCGKTLVTPSRGKFVSSRGVFGCRTGIIGSLTRGRPYIVIKQYIGCIFESEPGALEMFVRTP